MRKKKKQRKQKKCEVEKKTNNQMNKKKLAKYCIKLGSDVREQEETIRMNIRKLQDKREKLRKSTN